MQTILRSGAQGKNMCNRPFPTPQYETALGVLMDTQQFPAPHHL
jgi:hypothetical protein